MSAIGATGCFETRKTGVSNVVLSPYVKRTPGRFAGFLNDGQYARKIADGMEYVKLVKMFLNITRHKKQIFTYEFQMPDIRQALGMDFTLRTTYVTS